MHAPPPERSRSTARIGVIASSQRHTPPAQSLTWSLGSIPGHYALERPPSPRPAPVRHPEDYFDVAADRSGRPVKRSNVDQEAGLPIPPSPRSRCFSLAQMTRSATARCWPKHHRAPARPASCRSRRRPAALEAPRSSRVVEVGDEADRQLRHVRSSAGVPLVRRRTVVVSDRLDQLSKSSSRARARDRSTRRRRSGRRGNGPRRSAPRDRARHLEHSMPGRPSTSPSCSAEMNRTRVQRGRSRVRVRAAG